MESAVDESVDGYPVIGHLSKGSSCQVLLAKDQYESQVALKVLNTDLTEDLLHHALEEFPLMSNLKHANILKIYGFG